MARNSLMRGLATLAVLVLVSSPVAAEKLYKWVDQYGNVSYQDKPPPEGSGRVEQKNIRTKDTGAGGDVGGKLPVTLYSAPKCSQCDLARLYLKQRKVPFSEIDVSEKNPEAQQEMVKKVGELLIPTITVGSKVMKGYMESLLEGELNAAGYPKAAGKAPAEGEAAENAAK
jgi:glutaredoxin